APAPPLLEDQLADLLEDKSGGLMVSKPPPIKVDIYVKPLVELELDWQVRHWAEAAKQQLVELLIEEEQALLQEQAALMAAKAAEGQAAGFLAPKMSVAGAGMETAVEVVETAVIAVGGAEAAMAVEVMAAGESVDESEAQDGEDEADNEDEAPITPKRALTIGGSGPSPVVGKRASKSTTPSKRRSQKMVPQYEGLQNAEGLMGKGIRFGAAEVVGVRREGRYQFASLALPTA
ncbi:hypothetical protein C0992_005849, partial [Termitomyces sp. T32_za158]